MPIYYCDGKRLKLAMCSAIDWLRENKDFVNSLNVFPIPDGDTGTNMYLTFNKVVKDIENISEDLPHIAKTLANSSILGARGCSGVILSQILQGFAEVIGNKPRIYSMDIALALKMAAKKAYSAVDKPAEGTILTMLKEIGNLATILAESNKDIVVLLKHILERGEEILIETRDLLPELKRANVIDAGGKGFLVIIEGVLRLINGEPTKGVKIEATAKPIIQRETTEERYCLDFVLLGEVNEELKKELQTQGKDIVVAGSSGVAKIHIHTNNPDEIIELAKKYGKVENIKIDDTEKQYLDFITSINKIGIIAIVSGEGLHKVFNKLNCYTLDGGQTMNPSVEEIKIEIEKISADKIFILPNNKNIIPAAKKVKEVIDKEVYIIPTKTIPEGISAITAFSYEKSINENIKCMESAISQVKSGEITQAIRDSEYEDVKIKKGDYIGIYNHSIVASDKERKSALISLLKKMVGKDNNIISIFYQDKAENIKELELILNDEFPSMDIEIYYGGQPHYDYIISVE